MVCSLLLGTACTFGGVTGCSFARRMLSKVQVVPTTLAGVGEAGWRFGEHFNLGPLLPNLY